MNPHKQNIKANDDAQSGTQQGIRKQKEPVDVATLEDSVATSGNDPENPGPKAAGQAGG